VGSPWCSDRVGTREGTHRRPAATAHAVRTPFVPESQAACRCTDRQGLHADKRSQKAVHCCLWRWRSERELGACSLRLNRLARIFGKFLASGFFDEGTASEKSENRRINTGDLWWAWVDLNHRPRPYQYCGRGAANFSAYILRVKVLQPLRNRRTIVIDMRDSRAILCENAPFAIEAG